MDYTAEQKKLKQRLHSEITRLREENYSYNQIAKELNITPQYVGLICRQMEGGEAK